MASKKKKVARSSTGTATKKSPVKVKAVTKRAAGAAKKSTAKSTKPKSAKAKSEAPFAITHDQIAKRAYELWLEYGRPIGRDQVIWLQAERELSGNP